MPFRCSSQTYACILLCGPLRLHIGLQTLCNVALDWLTLANWHAMQRANRQNMPIVASRAARRVAGAREGMNADASDEDEDAPQLRTHKMYVHKSLRFEHLVMQAANQMSARDTSSAPSPHPRDWEQIKGNDTAKWRLTVHSHLAAGHHQECLSRAAQATAALLSHLVPGANITRCYSKATAKVLAIDPAAVEHITGRQSDLERVCQPGPADGIPVPGRQYPDEPVGHTALVLSSGHAGHWLAAASWPPHVWL
ncbi:hypothetical protein COO60DRAFT_549203 [Scenedesmus sp. NREL 46B-D3]|nr:hypothetical protein COO60DRAFT_549203 [Scenedesmus sp. NREL 46B-D3]